MAYLRGVTDGINMAAVGGDAKLRVCIPKGVTLGQTRLVLEKYLTDNPDKLHESAGLLTFSAIYLAFPCKDSN
jgi:hypothetical protein